MDTKNGEGCIPQDRIGSVPEMAAGRALSCRAIVEVGGTAYTPVDCQDISPAQLRDSIASGDTYFARAIEGVPADTALAILDLNAGLTCDGWHRWEPLGPIE